MKRKFILSIIFLSILSGAAGAETFIIDPNYTKILFRIKHLMGYEVGEFTKFKGEIVMDKDNAAITGLTGTIDMNGINTKNEDRDKDLKSDRFFDVEKFPEAKLVINKIDKETLSGDLTLHGVTKPVVLTYKFYGIGQDQYGRWKNFLSMKTTINRKDFDINFNTQTDDGKLLLGDEVDLTVELQGLAESALNAAPPGMPESLKISR